MTRPRLLSLTVVLFGLCLIGVLRLSFRDGVEYYVHVDEVAAITQHGARDLQVHGFVVPHSVVVRPATLDYRFRVQYRGVELPVVYHGIVPDTFSDAPDRASEVVLRGTRDASGVFVVRPNGILAKCPSKYVPVR